MAAAAVKISEMENNVEKKFIFSLNRNSQREKIYKSQTRAYAYIIALNCKFCVAIDCI
jgi:hypothetical protein